MTRNVKVSDEVFAAARSGLGSEQALVEAVGVAAGYNLVSRFLVALGVGEDTV
jgi:alkylhydroperoxidase family enzyme